MLSIQIPTSRERRTAARSSAVLALGLIFGLGACGDFIDFENPNNVVQEDVEKASAAPALANGALANTAQAMAGVQLALETVTDHMAWLGTFDDVGWLNRGDLSDSGGRYQQWAYDDLMVARWLSDEAITLLEAFDAEGTLDDRNDLARVYFYAAINYATAADSYESVALSDRQEMGPPIARQDMHTLYDMALQRLESAAIIAEETGNTELQLAILGFQARVHWARALWHKLAPKQTPADPLIDDALANALATQLVEQAPSDWKFQFTFNTSTEQSEAGFQINSRREITFDEHLAELDPSRRSICAPFNPDCPRDAIRVLDPIDEIPDPALKRHLYEFIQGFIYAPVTAVSARELRLILAEGALKRGDMGEFVIEINAVRALDGLTPYDPAVHTEIDPLELLIHMRDVNLILQPQRRLGDMYRFGIKSPHWIETGEAFTAPGTLLPMSRTEIISNCHIVGNC